MSDTAFDRVIDKLERFKRTGPSSGIASCPTAAHPNGDRSRGLSVRAIEDRVLIFCHAGCGAGEIVDALGLTLGELYDGPQVTSKPSRSRIRAADLLAIIDQEAVTVGLLALDFAETGQIPPEARTRLMTAVGRISRAREHASE